MELEFIPGEPAKQESWQMPEYIDIRVHIHTELDPGSNTANGYDPPSFEYGIGEIQIIDGQMVLGDEDVSTIMYQLEFSGEIGKAIAEAYNNEEYAHG